MCEGPFEHSWTNRIMCFFLQKKTSSRKNSVDSASTKNSSTEEKVRKLKHRNSELILIARQLEEKAKQLQKEKAAALQVWLWD